MQYQLIGWLAFNFIGMTFLNRVAAGAWIDSADVEIMNTLTITHSQEIFGLFSVPILNTDFFFVGIPRLVKWDYSFFGGNYEIVMYLLYSVTFAVSFMLFIIVSGMIISFFQRR